MRILFLCNSRLYGGAERYTVTVAGGLASHGHACFVAAPPGSPVLAAAATVPGVTGLPFEAGPKLSRRSVLDAAIHWRHYRRCTEEFLGNVMDVFGVDVLHAQFKKEQLLATPAAVALGLPVVWTEHGRLPPLLAAVLPAVRGYCRAGAAVHRVLCVSQFVLGDLTARGLAEDRLQVCYNGIEPAGAPAVSDGDRVRSRLGLDSRDFVVGCTGRLARVKGQHHLIHAVQVLRTRIPRLRLLLIGDGPERDSLERLTSQLDLTRHVRFLGMREDARELLACVDVFVAPSLSEGLPFAILEAMAAARPIVATRVGGVPEALDDGEVGLLIKPADAEPLVAALDRLYRDPVLRAELARAARARVVERFSIDTMIENTERTFLAAAGVRRPMAASPTMALAS